MFRSQMPTKVRLQDSALQAAISFPDAAHLLPLTAKHCCRQAYGMMGWRVGYIAYQGAPGGGDGFLGAQLLKVQDTIPVCPPQLSQARRLY